MAKTAFSAVATEVTRRLGGHDYSGFSARVQEWVTAAYTFLAIIWYHPELDTEKQVLLPLNASRVGLPDDIYLLGGVALEDSTGAFKKWLNARHFRVIVSDFRDEKAEPQRYARFGNSLLIDCRSNAGYFLRVYYYRKPGTPLFTGSNEPLQSELSKEMDEVIVEFSLALGQAAIHRRDLSEGEMGGASRWLEMLPNVALLSDVYADRPGRALTDTTHGGTRA